MQLKYIAVLVAAAFAQDDSSTDAPIAEATFKLKPGVCNAAGAECKKFGTGSDYSCVAVQSSTASLSQLSQCVKKADLTGSNICVSKQAGVCPTFASWPAAYRQVQPICAFVPDPKCTRAVTATGEVVSARLLQEDSPTTTKKATVECYQQEVPLTNGTVARVNGFYKCIDKELYRQKNYGLDQTQKQFKACAGNTTNGFQNGLCNGHGTCSPINAFSSEYACKCNRGYDEKDNCNVPTGNVCDGLGQCGALGECVPETGLCRCKPGSMGDQCSLCDIKSELACSGPTSGKCGLGGKCVCAPGIGGPQCEIKSVTEPPARTTGAPDGSSTAPSSAVEAAVSMAVLVTAAAALFA
ncbi:hypothetical protein DYB37_003412 [Aphanomyces astaci]|uniref:EGF-like domain-containing protein n=1 Tax=Aphanomyces astaci TaxID=112090 RepID=A0A3R7B9C2_APHAT|nr:hypothetical protein DYB35_007103 [Aphanomyces astaci]RHZ22337.1 hypothetical protein DYB37_003412 [Aphanomyces astaci]